MKHVKAFITAVCCAALWSCAPKTVMLDFNNVPDNERCNYMKEVCKDAERFQAQFNAMNREEQQEAKVILGAYIEQCRGAHNLCRATMDR